MKNRTGSGRIIFPLLLSTLLFSCNRDKAGKPLFELITNSGIDFRNDVTDGKLENSFFFRNFYNGGGVAIGDLNNDGLADVFFTSNMGENKLYLNKGDFNFTDITAKSLIRQDSMWSTGVTFVDINNDGWLDIYICNSGHMSSGHRENQLYINNHNLTFTESAAAYGLNISAYSTQVSFFDYDNDGDLDCFMINNSPIPVNTLNNSNRRDLQDADWPVAPFLKGGGDHLFRNDNGHFTDVTKAAGIHGSLISFGLGVSVGDVNGDGYPDIFVSNDSYERDYLYINQKNGTFFDELEKYFDHTSFSSMGADLADINNDGRPEVFTTDMLPEDDYRLKTLGSFDNIDLYNAKLKAGFYHQYVKNCLQLNDGGKHFVDIANYAGVSASDWSWGALMFDMDNDGFNDLFVCNGVNRDVTNLDFMDFFADDVLQKMVLGGKKKEIDDILKNVPVTPMLHKAFRNNGSLGFSDEGKQWGFTQSSFANGAAYGDLDNDGDLDLIINNENGPAFIYRNNADKEKNHYIEVSLKGTQKNRFAIGAKIKVFHGAGIFYRELIPSRGFQSSVDYKQVIGLGKLTSIDSMQIIWPDRSVRTFVRPAINKLYQVDELSGHNEHYADTVLSKISAHTLLEPVPAPFDKHAEDNNIDFYYERNIPKMLSREGPKAAVGDVNGDKLEDVYIGGTKGHPGQLYLQTPNGVFLKKQEAAFDQFIDLEDEAVLFFDADNDGDLDLFIGPGGNNHQAFSWQMQTRLFLNDGKGNFRLDPDAFGNSTGVNTGVAVAYDFNHDGFEDLFVGGRSVPREYGASPSSFLFVNDGHGHFKDIAKAKNPEIANIGMVTGAAWANVAGDKSKELIITGEWMAPRIFAFTGDHFEELHTNLSKLYGWWESVAVGDMNGDGIEDIILGNIGENFYLYPDSLRPVKLWVSDFDQNGILDNILTRTVDGKDMPVFLKHDLEAQLPILKKQNLKHKEFAKKSVQELFLPEVLQKASVKFFNYCSSVIAFNNGNGQFDIHKLPQKMQFSSINAIRIADVDGDGFLDLFAGGNEFGFLPQFGRLDGGRGVLVKNDGKGNLTCVDSDKSGIHVSGQTRDIVQIQGNNKSFILFLVNDELPALFEIKKP